MGNVSVPDIEEDDYIIPGAFSKKNQFSYIREQKEYNTTKKEEEFLLSPITPRFCIMNERKFDFGTHSVDSFSKEKNYGIIPIRIYHEVLMYLTPKDLINVFRSCKLIYSVSSTNLFWKSYYSSFFKYKEEIDQMEEVNWKKQFFKRFYFLTDCYYKRKFFKIKNEYDSRRYRREMRFLVLGNFKCAKEFSKSIFHHFYSDEKEIVEGEFGEVLICCSSSNRSMNEEFHISIFQPTSEEEFPTDVDGVFLCFYIEERDSFDIVRKVYKELSSSQNNVVTKYTVFILVGATKEEEENEENREVQYKESVTYATVENLLGYIECFPNTEKSRNCYLSFGILLEGVLRRARMKQDNLVVEMKLEMERKYGLMMSTLQDDKIVMK